MPPRLVIEGGSPLRGEVQVSAAKNAALPALCASLLTPQPVTLENVPDLADVVTTRSLLKRLGGEISAEADGSAVVRVARVTSHEAPYELVSTMRASVLPSTSISRASRSWAPRSRSIKAMSRRGQSGSRARESPPIW